MRATVPMVTLVTLLAGPSSLYALSRPEAPLPSQVPPDTSSAKPADPWAELIRAGRQEESIVSREDRAENNKTLDQSLTERKRRGLTGVIYGGVGFDALSIDMPHPYSPNGMFVGALFTAGPGLRLPLSHHWDLQSRVVVGFGSGSSAPAEVGSSLFSISSDLTLRARGGGASGRAGYFGMGAMVGGQFMPRKATVSFSSYGAAMLAPAGVLAVGFAGSLLEAGGVWGEREQWDLGVRWAVAGGNYFVSEFSLVFGRTIGFAGRKAEPLANR